MCRAMKADRIRGIMCFQIRATAYKNLSTIYAPGRFHTRACLPTAARRNSGQRRGVVFYEGPVERWTPPPEVLAGERKAFGFDGA